MTNRQNIRRIVAGMAIVTVVAMSVFVSSCVRRELSVAPGYVEISFDWSKLTTDQALPVVMEVFFYDENGSLVTTSITKNRTAKALLPTGKYKILAHKRNIVHGIMCKNEESYDNSYAYSLPLEATETSKTDYADAEWIQEPERWFYSAHISEMNVNADDTTHQVLTPKSLVRRLNLNVTLAGDTDVVTDINGGLTGLAPQVLLASEVRRGGSSNVAFKAQTFEGGIFKATVLAFGTVKINDDGSKPSNTVLMGVNFNNGGFQVIELDLGDKLSSIEDSETNVITNIDIDVNVDVSATSEGNFTARVTKWTVMDSSVIVDNAD